MRIFTHADPASLGSEAECNLGLIRYMPNVPSVCSLRNFA